MDMIVIDFALSSYLNFFIFLFTFPPFVFFKSSSVLGPSKSSS